MYEYNTNILIPIIQDDPNIHHTRRTKETGQTNYSCSTPGSVRTFLSRPKWQQWHRLQYCTVLYLQRYQECDQDRYKQDSSLSLLYYYYGVQCDTMCDVCPVGLVVLSFGTCTSSIAVGPVMSKQEPNTHIYYIRRIGHRHWQDRKQEEPSYWG
jgi:hypothetical protein